MRLKAIITVGLLFLLINNPAYTQDHEDAIRFSAQSIPAHARTTATMNSGGAAGAHPVAGLNPAGLALYRNSEVSVSTGFLYSSTNSTFHGDRKHEWNTSYNIPNFSIVYHEPFSSFGQESQDGWISYTLAATYNRTHNFHEANHFESDNIDHSMTQAMAERSTGMLPEDLPWLDYMAWELFLIDNPDQEQQYQSIIESYEDPSNMRMHQSRTMHRSGRKSELDFSFAANYDHRLYIGGSIKIPRINYSHQLRWNEYNRSDSVNIYKSMHFEEDVKTSGNAFGLSLGAIYRFSDHFRAGFRVNTPLRYSLEDEWSYDMWGHFTDVGRDETEDPPEGEFSFNYATPVELSFMGAATIGEYGMISVDVTTSDPSSARFSSDDYDFSEENNNIEEFYQRVYSMRSGAEFLNGPFAFRIGYGFTTSPVKEDYRWNDDQGYSQMLSAGIGLRVSDYTIDFAWLNTSYSEPHQPYSLEEQNVLPATQDISRNAFILSGGYRF